MFEIHDTKAFMDMVHGYINIPKLFVKHIIDTKEFQRLHFVDQTGMRPVYPGAKHTRFIHSLGVYHLGLRAANALLDNFKENAHWNIRSDDSLYVFWAKNKVLFLLACLLHDVGHAPYSHSMEKFFVEGNNEYNLHSTLANVLGLSNPGSEYTAMTKAAPHEQVSALMAMKIFREPVGQILDSLGESDYPQIQGYGYSEYQQKPPRIDRSELDEDLCFIARMILGLKYIDYRPEYQIRNCFIELLNGKNFDVDKLDYIIRDTKMSGISNISLDVERLLSSLTIVPITNYRDFNFMEPFSALAPVFLLDVVPANDAELVINGAIDVPLQFRDQKVTLYPGTCFSMYGCSSVQDGKKTGATVHLVSRGYFSGNSQIQHLVDSKYKALVQDPERKDIVVQYSEDDEIYIFKEATVIDDPFSFEIHQSEIVLTVEGNAKIGLTALEKSNRSVLSSTHFTGEISGKAKSLCMLDDQLGNMVPAPNTYISFALGFKKQAVNIITNVMDARDYLYLWIYAHHKVVYYANYLVIELPRLAYMLLHKPSDTGLEELFNYDTFTTDNLDEPALFALIREANRAHSRWKIEVSKPEEVEQKLHQRFETLYEEFFSRQYKKSVYKSLAEYDTFFRDFTLEEKGKLRQLLPSETSVDPTTKYISDPKYGIWDQDTLEKNQITTLGWLVWIDSSYSRKILDMSKVYICFRQDVLNVERIPIIRKEYGNIQNFRNYFYLYYQPKQSAKPADIERELKAYFGRLVRPN